MEDNHSILDLQVDKTASKNLSDAARWARFLSIAGFVCMGIVVIFFIAMRSTIASTLSQAIPGLENVDSFGMLIAVVLISAALICLLMYFLFKGSTLIRKGIETKSQETFNSGLASLKAYFIMYGILIIIELISNLISIF